MQITFIDVDGIKHSVDANEGSTLMEVAVANDISGIDADCGGGCSCATCHVHVAKDWLTQVGEPGDIESSMLDFQSSRRDNSRLSCQITLTNALDGLIVSVAEHD